MLLIALAACVFFGDPTPDPTDSEPIPCENDEEIACDDLDDDCDGLIDEGLKTQYFLDADGDGYGESPLLACEPRSGIVEESGDCDDDNWSVYPGANEICDEDDQDCDGSVDEGADCG